MVGDDPGPFYLMNATMVIKFGFSPSEIDNMISWERDFMIVCIEKDQIEKNKQIEAALR